MLFAFRRTISSSAAVVLALAGASAPARAVEVGEEAEITAAAVTALSCALRAQQTGRLDELSSCPLAEAASGLVLFDVAEKQIYRIAAKKLRRSDMERAFGGGNIDVTGVVVKVAKDGIPELDVAEFAVTPKPKPGAFKGCL